MSADSYTHVRTRVRKSPTWVAMLTRFPFLAHTGLSWGCFFLSCFRCRFLFALGRVWSPTWPQLGPILEPCWPLFGTFLGAALASSFKVDLQCDFDWFLLDLQSPASSISLRILSEIEDARPFLLIALEADSGSILGRCLNDFWRILHIWRFSRN